MEKFFGNTGEKMRFKKLLLIFSMMGCVLIQTACGNNVDEEMTVIEQEEDTPEVATEIEVAEAAGAEGEDTETKKTAKAETAEAENTDAKKTAEVESKATEQNLKATKTESKEQPNSDTTKEEETGLQIDRQDIKTYDTPVTLYAKQKVNIRKGPSTDFDVLGMLALNDQVIVVGESISSPWKEIQYQDETAFVHGEYLLTEPVDLEALKAEQEAARAAAEAAKAAEEAAKQQEAVQAAQSQPASQTNPAPQSEVVAPAGILFIGDSRTCQMKSATGGANCSWICEYGTSYDWFEQTAIPKADQLIGQGTKVVICMGVNDPNHLNSYASLVNRKAGDWNARGAQVYFVSLNPCAQPYEDKNPQIDSFNATMPGLLSGVKWIDTASTVKQGGYLLVDGIHYDAIGNLNIFNLICGNL